MEKTITDEYDINDLIKVMQNRINELTTQNILLETRLLSKENGDKNKDKKIGNSK
jgi:hypothetical protein